MIHLLVSQLSQRLFCCNDAVFIVFNRVDDIVISYAAFDYTSDPELTESCIFEIRALQSRMNYLLRQIKELEACSATAVTAHAGGRGRWT